MLLYIFLTRNNPTQANRMESCLVTVLVCRWWLEWNRFFSRQPFSFINPEVVEATCQCLLAQAEESERNQQDEAQVEALILEEFGRCLVQIIEIANKSKIPSSNNSTAATSWPSQSGALLFLILIIVRIWFCLVSSLNISTFTKE